MHNIVALDYSTLYSNTVTMYSNSTVTLALQSWDHVILSLSISSPRLLKRIPSLTYHVFKKAKCPGTIITTIGHAVFSWISSDMQLSFKHQTDIFSSFSTLLRRLHVWSDRCEYGAKSGRNFNSLFPLVKGSYGVRRRL